MARTLLVTGGSRSGKSAYAQALAESLPGPRGFVATCPVIDDEMQRRIAKHQKARSKGKWRTIEETLDLPGVIVREAKCPVLLVDCLTLWINNLMYDAEQHSRPPVAEEQVAARCREILAACASRGGGYEARDGRRRGGRRPAQRDGIGGRRVEARADD